MSKDFGRRRRRSSHFPEDIRNMLRADGCAGKIAFDERADAARAQHGMASKGKSCKVYQCVACGKYHLASNKSHGRRRSNGH